VQDIFLIVSSGKISIILPRLAKRPNAPDKSPKNFFQRAVVVLGFFPGCAASA
jgi:hypothetical protein